MSEKVGFLEESKGVRSMTRLSIGWLLTLTSALVATIAWYVVHMGEKANPLVVTALVGGLTALVLNGIVAVIKRNGGEAPAP
jgi:hypothetical protein